MKYLFEYFVEIRYNLFSYLTKQSFKVWEYRLYLVFLNLVPALLLLIFVSIQFIYDSMRLESSLIGLMICAILFFWVLCHEFSGYLRRRVGIIHCELVTGCKKVFYYKKGFFTICPYCKRTISTNNVVGVEISNN